MDPHVVSLDETSNAGVRVYDPIEASQAVLYTEGPVEPEPADPAAFPVPVDTAVRIDRSRLVVPVGALINVLGEDADHRDSFDPSTTDERSYPDARFLDVTSFGLKLYLRVADGATLTYLDGDEQIVVEAGGKPVEIGVRSAHEHPAETITVPPNPREAFPAFSALGSALKTTSPERSWPTLRGHPPAFEVGDELDIPDGVQPPETDVELHLPAEWSALYPAAPVAHYLGATVTTATDGDAALVAGNYRERLGDDVGEELRRILRQVLYCDTVVRSGGIYDVRPESASNLPASVRSRLGAEDLYDRPLAEQVQTYLRIPFEDIESQVPRWPLTVAIDAKAEYLSAIPHLVDDLALLRCTSSILGSGTAEKTEEEETVDEFYRGEESDRGETIMVNRLSGMERAYVGERVPYGANKIPMETFETMPRTESPPESYSLTVEVVCNDEEMDAETSVRETYELHDFVKIDVTFHENLSTAEVEEVFATEPDLLHYIGHIDEDGMRCHDGFLDARTIERGRVPDLFVLNACTSYEQGKALLDAGSIGGVSTLTRVGNGLASHFGRTVARALNAGFTLRSAVRLANLYNGTAGRYLCLGAGGYQVVQAESGSPYLVDVRRVTPEEQVLDIYSAPAPGHDIGYLMSLDITNHEMYLGFGHLDRVETETTELLEWLDTQSVPVAAGGKLFWSDAVTEETLLGDVAEATPSGTNHTAAARLGRNF